MFADPDAPARLAIGTRRKRQTRGAATADHYKLFLVIGNTQLQAEQSIADVAIKSVGNAVVRVRDVGAVSRSTVPHWTSVTADGHEAVLLNIYQQPDGNTVHRIARAQSDQTHSRVQGTAPGRQTETQPGEEGTESHARLVSTRSLVVAAAPYGLSSD